MSIIDKLGDNLALIGLPEIDNKTAIEIGLGALILLAIALTKKRTKKVISADETVPPEEVVEETVLDRQMKDLEKRLSAKELNLGYLKGFLAEDGCGTNDPDILRLFQLVHEKNQTKTAKIHIDKDFSEDSAIRSIYEQVTGNLPPSEADPEDLWEEIKKHNFALAITVDAHAAYRNIDIGVFQNRIRGLEQHSRVPVCAYSENMEAIPTEIVINLRFFGTRGKLRRSPMD